MAVEDRNTTPPQVRYPRRVAYIAGLRALAGVVMSAVFWTLSGGTVLAMISSGCLLVFFGYGLIAVRRAMDIVTLSPDGILVRGLRRLDLPFANMTSLQLAYYSTRKDGERGWMELVVRSAGQKLVIESEIEGFRQIAKSCFRHASERGLELSPASERNFDVLLDEKTPAGLEAGFGFAGASR